MNVFKRVNFAQEKETMKDVCESLLSSSENYLMKALGQAFGISGGSFPDSIDPEAVKMINDALAYWQESKALMIQQARIMDNRHEALCKELEEQRKFLDQQSALLREQNKALEEISRKLDKVSSKTKAE